MGLCVPPKNKTMTLVPESSADALLKDIYQRSMISAYFRVSPRTSIEIECSGGLLTPNEVRVLRRAVRKNATYQWYVGGIAVTGLIGGSMIGESGTLVPALYTHRQISIGYNGKRIVEATLRPGRPEELGILLERQLTMTYEIVWHPSTKLAGERFNVSNTSKAYFESGRRWIGLSNIYLVSAILLAVMISIYRNALGWSGEEHFLICVTKEIFHPPEMPGLFSALLGLGAQCMTALLLFAVVGKVSGSTNTLSGNELLCQMVLYYGIAGFFGGLVSGKAFASYKSRGWLYPYLYLISIPYAAVMALLMAMDVAGSSLPSAALLGPSSQFSTYSKLYLSYYWLIAVIPLTFAGTLLGRSLYRDEAKKEKASSRHKNDPLEQELPTTSTLSSLSVSPASASTTPSSSSSSTTAGTRKGKWYQKKFVPLFLCALAGGSATLSELNFIYEGVWGVSDYYCYITYGITLLSIFGALLVVGFSSALGTYYTLGIGNFCWKWTSVECGALSGVVVLVFSWNYYLSSGMHGALQGMAFIGFSVVVSGMVALSEGFVAYLFSKYFIRNIYRLSKSE